LAAVAVAPGPRFVRGVVQEWLGEFGDDGPGFVDVLSAAGVDGFEPALPMTFA
jgi:hypothetical protein